MAEGFKRFLNAIGFGEEDGDDYLREEDEPMEIPVPRKSAATSPSTRERPKASAPKAPASKAKTQSTMADYRPGSYAQSASTPVSSTARRNTATMGRVYSMPYAQPAGTETMHMMVLQPRSFEDTQMVIDQLVMGKAVVLNLETLKQEAAQRVLDFVSGAIYAVSGNIRKVSKGVFILVPQGVDIAGNISASYATNVPGHDSSSSSHR